MPATIADLTSFFSSIKEHHFKNGRKITIYFHDIGILQCKILEKFKYT
jgi:hypothetical protein